MIPPAVLVVVIIVAVLLLPVAFVMGINQRKRTAEAQYGSAEAKARRIVDDAIKEAEGIKREAKLEVKEEIYKIKSDLDKEVKERRNELSRLEKRVLQKEETLDRKSEQFEKKEQSLSDRDSALRKEKERVEAIKQQHLSELEKISGLTLEQAKDYLLKSVEEDVKHETAVLIKEHEARAKEEVDKNARKVLANAIQRCAADHVADLQCPLSVAE